SVEQCTRSSGAMLPSPVRSTVTGAEDESEEQYFSVPQSVTIEASVHTGLITAVHPGIVPQTSYGDETEYHHIPQRYLVFPGLVDPHVHLNEPGRTDWEGFETGTDDDLLPLVKAGVRGFKCFLIESGVDKFPCVSIQDLEKSMPILQDADSMLMFHAELDCGEGSEKTSEQAPHKGQARSGPESVRELSGLQGAPFELDAIELVIRLNKQYLKLRTHIVHLSAADALPLIQEAQTVGGLPLTTEDQYSSGKRKGDRLTGDLFALFDVIDRRDSGRTCGVQVLSANQDCSQPRIRTAANRDELCKGLESGIIDFVVSDHSPCTAELKEGSLMEAWGGIGGLGLGLSLLWTEGRARALSNLEGRLLKWLCELCSLKGSLAPRYQCDLCIFTPTCPSKLRHNLDLPITYGLTAFAYLSLFVFSTSPWIYLRQKVTKEDLKFKNKISAYLGKRLSGRVVSTVLATELSTHRPSLCSCGPF
ncbi:hypothetical protein PSHT_13866, partial [Puccinia striiformis]